MGLIYKIANDINNKVYIGQTRQKLNRRISQHKCNRRYNSILHKAIDKYGWEHFKVEVLEDNIPLENLNERELYWTDKFNALAPNGYVLIAGGEPRIVSEETKKKLSEIGLGRKHSSETKTKISLGNKGKIISNKTKEKISKSKLGQKTGILNHRSKRILCYDLNNNFIEKFDSINIASKELNLNVSHIVKVCQGKRNKTGKYKFFYYEEKRDFTKNS